VDFPEGPREIIRIVKTGVQCGLGYVHFSAGKKIAGAVETLAEEELMERMAGLLLEDAVEMVGACAAGLRHLGEGQLRRTGGLFPDDRQDALGQQTVTP
jgi:hypothetical protein